MLKLKTAVTASIAAFALVFSLGVSSPATAVPVDGSVPPAGNITEQSVGVQMFMWPWRSLATECTDHLGPSGVDWIWVSPPQEHVQGSAWWVHYQPVSYKLESNLGTRDEFIDMVHSCNRAGVRVVVDAVINHMANSSGTGFDGTKYTKYNYPGLYDESDFHATNSKDDPTHCPWSISNYNNAFQLVNCELGGLPDLTTERPSVQAKIATYLNDLLAIGVYGFRIDAAKHFGATELEQLQNRLTLVNGQKPWFAAESIGGRAENDPFLGSSDVWLWSWPDVFRNIFYNGSTKIATNFAARYALQTPSNKSITFVTNHDTEHNGQTSLTYIDGKEWELAQLFMLADNYGKPMLYSGYAFSSESQGPLLRLDGRAIDASCADNDKVINKRYESGTFICTQRLTSVQGMIAWKDQVGASPVTGAKVSVKKQMFRLNRGPGFLLVNNDNQKRYWTVSTGLPAGTYCDRITGGKDPVADDKTCVGKTVVVKKNKARIWLAPKSALALDLASEVNYEPTR